MQGSFRRKPDSGRGKSMLTCPKCHAGVPEGMRFCLQCGASVAPPLSPAAPPPAADPPVPIVPAAPYAAPPPASAGPSTVPLKIAATPVMTPRFDFGAQGPGPGDAPVEDPDEALKRSFLRPVTQPGAVICRFCKGPLDLAGDFCEQCGAPVAEAAPPGAVRPKPQPPAPVTEAAPPEAAKPKPQPAPPHMPPPATTASGPGKPAPSAPSIRPPAGSPSGRLPSASPPSMAKPAAPTATTPSRPAHPPPPASPTVPPTPSSDEQQSGLVGRLKGLFKKS